MMKPVIKLNFHLIVTLIWHLVWRCSRGWGHANEIKWAPAIDLSDIIEQTTDADKVMVILITTTTTNMTTVLTRIVIGSLRELRFVSPPTGV